MNPLDYFAPRNDEWVKMAHSITSNYSEVLQEAYIKLHETFKNRTEDLENMHPNQLGMYVWLTLKSCSIAVSKRDGKYQELGTIEDREEEEYHEAPDNTKLMQVIEAELRGFHWYDRKLFKLHYEDGMAMREIARETNISLSSIFHTLKICRTTLKDKLDARRN